MKTNWLLLVVLVFILASPALPIAIAAEKTGGAVSEKDIEKGKALFKAQCQVCHINRQEGDQPTDYTRQFHPADFSDPDHWRDLDKREIRNVVKKGRGAMPAQRQLKPDQIEAIAEYLVKTYQPKGK